MRMNAVHIAEVLESDGELRLTGLPYSKGQKVEVLVFSDYIDAMRPPQLTAEALMHSGVVGLWEARADLPESIEYARQLREQAQHRQR